MIKSVTYVLGHPVYVRYVRYVHVLDFIQDVLRYNQGVFCALNLFTVTLQVTLSWN